MRRGKETNTAADRNQLCAVIFFLLYHSVLLFDFVPLPTVPTCFCVLGRGKGGIGTKEKHFLGRMGAHFFAVVEKKFTFR